MVSAAFVCEICLNVIRDKYDRVEERLEYRRSWDQSRYRVILQRRLCLSCVDQLTGGRYNPKPPAGQEELFA